MALRGRLWGWLWSWVEGARFVAMENPCCWLEITSVVIRVSKMVFRLLTLRPRKVKRTKRRSETAIGDAGQNCGLGLVKDNVAPLPE